ncbi:MAG: glycosyl transferase [Hyphococcus sp.]|nr:MAG: glycosyl transferase [Marinicaulis sp.]
MTFMLSMFVWGVALLISIPVLVFCLEVLSSFFPAKERREGVAPASVAIIVPAHNEGEHIKNTLADIKAQLRACDRLIVVADNCSDNTFEIAVACGAEVFVRTDPDRRGKGYALQFAIDQLQASPPECVVFLDADCRVEEGVLLKIAAIAHSEKRPAQAMYLMTPPEEFHPRTNVSVFAWMMMNKVRMTGLQRMAGVTRFTGAGLAAPWSVVSKLPFATGDITEDLVLTFKMTELGAAPLLVSSAVVTSEFPAADKARVTQRARWEHGSLGVIFHHGLPAMWRSLKQSNLKLLALSFDAVVPPIILLGALLLVVAGLCLLFSMAVGVAPFVWVAGAAAIYIASILVGWLAYGRDVLPPSKLGSLGPFLFDKLKIYGDEGRASTKVWTRTDRDDGAP